MSKASVCLLAVCAMLAIGTSARGAEPLGWRGEFTPYAWFAGLSGDLTVDGQTVEFEKSASDLMEAVETGLSLLTVVQYNRFVFWGQGDFFSLSTDELDVEDQPEGGVLNSDLTLLEFAIGYQVDGWKEGQTFDLMVGMRSMSMEVELEVDGGSTYSRTNDLVDPMIVIRPSFPLFPSKIRGLVLNPTFGLGGGGDSDFVYELAPQLRFQFAKHFDARFGYRTIGYKFKGAGDDEFNISLAGLTVGVGGIF